MRTLLGCWLVVFLALTLTAVTTARPQLPPPATENKPAPDELRPEDIVRILVNPVFRHASGVQCVTVSPDGKKMLTGTKDGAFLWDVGSGKKIRKLLAGDVRSLSMHSSIAAVGTSNGYISVFDIATGKEQLSMTFPGVYARWLPISPDGSTLAFNVGSEIQLCSTTTGKLTGTLTGHTENVCQAVFHPDGKTLLSVSADGTLRQWNLATGKETKRLSLGPEWIAVALALSKDGKSLALVANWQFSDKLMDSFSQVRVLSTAGWKERFRVRVPESMAHDVSISPDGRHVAALLQWPLSKDQHIPLWDTWTAKQTRVKPESDQLLQLPANGLQFLPDGKTLATTGEDGCIRLWNIADGKQHASTQGTPGPISALKFSSTGNVVASTGPSGGIQLWDAVKGGKLHQLDKNSLDDIVLSPDGRFVVSLGKPDFTNKNAGASLWDVRTGVHKHTLKNLYRCAAFSPDGTILAGGDDQNNIRLWDVAKGTELRKLSGHILRVNAVAIAGDGATMASASDDGVVRLWQMATGKCLGSFEWGCRDLWFSRDGTLLFVATHNNDGVTIYETLTGNCVLPLTAPAPPAYPTKRGSYAMVQDGATLLYTPWPGQFVAIDIATGEPFGPDIAHGYGGQYKTGEFSADGRILALGYADGGLLLHKSPAAPPRKLLPATIDVDKLKKLWQSLAQPDAKFAYKARLQLKAASQQTLALFRQELKPQKADAKQLADWIEQLGSTSFKQRESALTALEKAGDAAQQALESALARKPVLEEKLRIELLLGKIKPLPSGETLRALRAIVILEAIGSEDARTVLRDLAEGAPGARVTEAAKAALKRM